MTWSITVKQKLLEQYGVSRKRENRPMEQIKDTRNRYRYMDSTLIDDTSNTIEPQGRDSLFNKLSWDN